MSELEQIIRKTLGQMEGATPEMPPETLIRKAHGTIGGLNHAIRRLIRERDEAEQRGYRKGVEDAAGAIGEALESPVEQQCCGFGIGTYGGPPECCNNPISLIDGYKAHDAILALLDKPKLSEPPHNE